jgi:hypothetical protein
LKERKGGNICLSLEDEKLRFKGFWRLKGKIMTNQLKMRKSLS